MRAVDQSKAALIQHIDVIIALLCFVVKVAQKRIVVFVGSGGVSYYKRRVRVPKKGGFKFQKRRVRVTKKEGTSY